MRWKTAITVLVILGIGYFLGSRYPGFLSRATAGTVPA